MHSHQHGRTRWLVASAQAADWILSLLVHDMLLCVTCVVLHVHVQGREKGGPRAPPLYT